MSIMDLKDSPQVVKVKEKYSHEIERYDDQKQEIQSEARKYEKEVALEQRKADRFDLGEVLLEAGLVITSMTLITGRRAFWKLGVASATAGVAVAVTGLLVR